MMLMADDADDGDDVDDDVDDGDDDGVDDDKPHQPSSDIRQRSKDDGGPLRNASTPPTRRAPYFRD